MPFTLVMEIFVVFAELSTSSGTMGENLSECIVLRSSFLVSKLGISTDFVQDAIKVWF